MENNVIVRKWKNTGFVKVDDLSGLAFTGESGAHSFRIQGFDADDNKQPITGTISGKFWNKDTDITTPLTGSLDDGDALVTFDPACYANDGLFVLTLFSTNGSTVTCIYCGVGSVKTSQSSTIAYPTAAIPDVAALINQIQAILNSWPSDYTQLQNDVSSLKSAVNTYPYLDLKQINKTFCKNINTAFEQGAFTSTNPSVANTMSLRTVGYFDGGVYIVNPGGRLAWAILKYPSTFPDSGSGTYVAGTVASRSNNFYRDEIFYVSVSTGYKYRLRVAFDASPGRDITVDINSISIYKPVVKQYGYTRHYTDVTSSLVWERKSLGTNSGITDSTTRLLAKLPNVGNVEVKMNTPNSRFAVFQEDNSGDTPVYTALISGTWTWFYYRFTADPAYNYYVMTRFETESTITPDYGGKNVKVYVYDDEGIGGTDINPLYGKSVAVFGDSIVQGRFRKNNADSTNAVMPKPYPVLLSELCNTEPGDYGIGGATVYGSGWNTLYTRRQAVTGYDVVLVHAGTNDFGDNISESDFRAAYETVLTALKGNNTKVYAVTPVTRATNNANAGGHYLSDYVGWIKDTALTKSVEVIDLYALTASDDLFKAQLPDNIHPNETGQKMIADLILNNIP